MLTSRKRVVRLALLLTTGIAVACVAPVAPRDLTYALLSGRGAFVAEPLYECKTPPDGKVSHTFRIYNLQNRNLKVEISPSCGCMSLTWTRASVPPFRWRDLTVTMAVDMSAARTDRYLTVKTDDLQAPYLFAFIVVEGGARSN